MNVPRLHYDTSGPKGAPTKTACGKWWMPRTRDRALVTCKSCIAAMDAGAERPLQPYLPSGRKPLKRKPKVEEPKDSFVVPGCKGHGLQIVIDSPQVKLKKVAYPG